MLSPGFIFCKASKQRGQVKTDWYDVGFTERNITLMNLTYWLHFVTYTHLTNPHNFQWGVDKMF